MTNKPLFDPYIISISLCLILFGLVLVFSASISVSDANWHDPFHYLYRQLIAVALGILLSAMVVYIPLHVWQKLSVIFLFLALFLLLIVLIPGVGREVKGSTRWISFVGFNFQVSELIKFAMIIYMAGYILRRESVITQSWRSFITPILVISVTAILLLLEPDLGATFIVASTVFALLFLAGVRLWPFFLAILVAALLLQWLIVSEPYRYARLISFLNPWDDPFKQGFQLTQALIAFGRGEWFGIGLGNSIQKLFYLPEAHTDFIIAVLAEELGIVGVIVLLALFTALLVRIFQIAQMARKRAHFFAAYVAEGIAIWISLQVFVNLGVNMGILPTKGITLPFISYGGSSMMIMCMVMAVVLRIDHENRFRKPLSLMNK